MSANVSPALAFLSAALLASSPAYADPSSESDPRFARVRLLYECYTFTSAMQEAMPNLDQKEKLKKKARIYLVLATTEVLALDKNPDPLNTDLANKYQGLGKRDFLALMREMDTLSGAEERNAKLNELAVKCTNVVKP